MSLTKLTRRLAAIATDLHVATLRSAITAHGKATAAANAAWSQAIRLEQHAEQYYTDIRREELQAISRYEAEVYDLGRSPSELYDHA